MKNKFKFFVVIILCGVCAIGFLSCRNTQNDNSHSGVNNSTNTDTEIGDDANESGNRTDSSSTPTKTYIITFNLDKYPDAVIESKTMTVQFNAQYNLYTPTLLGYEFVEWRYNGRKFEQSGVYTIENDIILTAEFKFDNNWVTEPEIK